MPMNNDGPTSVNIRKPTEIPRLGWRAQFAAIACVVVFLFEVSIAQEPLSDVAFQQLKADVQAQLDRRYKASQDNDELFPGATFAFELPDSRTAGFAVGFSDVKKRLLMQSESRMPSGSIGKTYVAATVMAMVDDGLLNLDGTIDRWLGDESWFERLPNRDTITVRHLLNHSSGIIDHVFESDSQFPQFLREQLDSNTATRAFDPRDLVRFVLDREQLFPAGDGFHYSDTNYILLGMIIEKASQSPYYSELAARFLKPLHLERTSPLNRRDVEGLATGYAPESQRLFGLPLEIVNDGQLAFDPSLEWTGGGLVSTSEDLVRWAVALFSGKALPSKQVDEMLHSIAVPEHYSDDPGRDYGYGLGINVAHTSLGVAYRHGGFFPGYNSMLAYFPDTGIAVAMQINTDQSNIEEHFEALAEIVVSRVSRERSISRGSR